MSKQMVTDLAKDEKVSGIFYTPPPPRSEIYEKEYVSKALEPEPEKGRWNEKSIFDVEGIEPPKYDLIGPIIQDEEPTPRTRTYTNGKYKYTGKYTPYSPKKRISEKAIMERRKLVDALMKKGHKNSYRIAEMLNEPRGNIWHDILYLRKHPITTNKVAIPITIVKK